MYVYCEMTGGETVKKTDVKMEGFLIGSLLDVRCCDACIWQDGMFNEDFMYDNKEMFADYILNC